MGSFANLEVVLHNTCTTQKSNMDIQNLTVDYFAGWHKIHSVVTCDSLQ